MNKFDRSNFKKDIEFYINEYNYSILDAILHWCEAKGLELEYAATLVKRNKDILNQLEEEVTKTNFLKKPVDTTVQV